MNTYNGKKPILLLQPIHNQCVAFGHQSSYIK